MDPLEVTWITRRCRGGRARQLAEGRVQRDLESRNSKLIFPPQNAPGRFAEEEPRVSIQLGGHDPSWLNLSWQGRCRKTERACSGQDTMLEKGASGSADCLQSPRDQGWEFWRDGH